MEFVVEGDVDAGREPVVDGGADRREEIRRRVGTRFVEPALRPGDENGDGDVAREVQCVRGVGDSVRPLRDHDAVRAVGDGVAGRLGGRRHDGEVHVEPRARPHVGHAQVRVLGDVGDGGDEFLARLRRSSPVSRRFARYRSAASDHVYRRHRPRRRSPADYLFRTGRRVGSEREMVGASDRAASPVERAVAPRRLTGRRGPTAGGAGNHHLNSCIK